VNGPELLHRAEAAQRLQARDRGRRLRLDWQPDNETCQHNKDVAIWAAAERITQSRPHHITRAAPSSATPVISDPTP
jgi:hypothetical protein